MSGAVAFRRLAELAVPETFDGIVQTLNAGSLYAASRTSCNLNNIAIIKTLTNQPIVAGPMASAIGGLGALGVRQGQSGMMTAAVMQKLAEGRLVSFDLQLPSASSSGGDHYFSAFQLDAGTIVAAMGWQNLYALPQWFRENDGGRFPRERFEALLARAEGNDINALIELCSFLGATEESAPRSIIETLANDLSGCTPRFRNTYYLTLPTS
jgi:hypothetical protein